MAEVAGDGADVLAIVEAMPDGVVLMDRGGRLKASNALLAAMFGLDADSLWPGRPVADVMGDIARRGGLGAGVDAAPDEIAALVTEWIDGSPMRERREMSDGRVIDVQVQRLPGGDVMVIHQDVTELAATSAANDELADNLRAMIDHLHDGMCLTDGHGHLIAFNPRFLTLFGVAPGAIAWGAHCRSLAAAFRDLDHLSATQRAVEAARRLRILTDPTLSCTLQSFPDGRTVDMARSAIAHDRWVVRLTDVSEVREVWRGLADERQSVEDRRRRRAASIAQMNHELRAPLNGILGMAALLKQTGLEPGQLKFVEVIHQSGDFLLRMIEDTQSIAQLEAGSLPLMRERFALGRLVTETVEALRPVAEDKGLTLRIDGTSALLPEVMGDRQRLAQCLANLMTNAIRYTDRGFVGVTLAVKARAGSLDVRIDVADSGIGISAEHHDRVFEQFYQVRDGDTRRGGVGLGLAITRGIMQAMGGSVSLSSTPGNGSTFTLSVALPVASTAHATPLPSQQAATG